MIIIDCEQRSEAWHQVRLGRFTASKFSDVMAGETTETYKGLIVDIAGEILTGEAEEGYTSADMERGVELEPEARYEYSLIAGDVIEIGFVIPDETDELHDFVGVSPDGFINDGILEIKCPKLKTHLNYIRANVLPNAYKWQVQGQLMITGAKWCDFMSYYPKLKPFIIRVLPDLKMQEELRARLLSSIEKVKETIEIYNNYEF